jgi:hypothetical protein
LQVKTDDTERQQSGRGVQEEEKQRKKSIERGAYSNNAGKSEIIDQYQRWKWACGNRGKLERNTKRKPTTCAMVTESARHN